VPSEPPLPIELDELPLVGRTELRDVRLVAIDAQAPEEPEEGVAVHFAMDEMAYRVADQHMFVRVGVHVRYIVDVAEESPGGENVPEGRQIAQISLVLLAELAFSGGAISQPQADEFIERNLLFMIYPYIRTSVQQVSADLRLPLTVLPYLRRDGASLTQNQSQKDPNAPL
jgi:hypothetical protein